MLLPFVPRFRSSFLVFLWVAISLATLCVSSAFASTDIVVEPVPGVFIVKFRQDAPTWAVADNRVGIASFDAACRDFAVQDVRPAGWLPPELSDRAPNIRRMAVLEFPDTVNASALAARISELSYIEFFEQDTRTLGVFATPNDPKYTQHRQFDLENNYDPEDEDTLLDCADHDYHDLAPHDCSPPNNPPDCTPDPFLSDECFADIDVDAEAAWDVTTGDSDVIVAVIDRDGYFFHPDLAPNAWVNVSEDENANGIPDEDDVLLNTDDDNNGKPDDISGWNYGADPDDGGHPVPGSHGTGIAGVIAARTNNELGVAGLAGGWGSERGVRLMSLVDTNTGGWSASNIVDAAAYMITAGVDIVSISIGLNVTSKSVVNAISDLLDEDVLLVVAAGNDNHEPIAFPGLDAINVGAFECTGERWVNEFTSGGSQFGTSLSVLGPAADGVASTFPQLDSPDYSVVLGVDSYGCGSGTSFATPHVAATAALLRSIDPSLPYETLREIIVSSAIDVRVDNECQSEWCKECAMVGRDKWSGGGRLNAWRAVTHPTVAVLDPSSPTFAEPGDVVTIKWRVFDVNDDLATSGQTATVEANPFCGGRESEWIRPDCCGKA